MRLRKRSESVTFTAIGRHAQAFTAGTARSWNAMQQLAGQHDLSIPPAHAQRDRPHVPTNQCQPTQHDRRQARTNIAHPPASARRCRKLCCSVRMFAATCLLRSQDGSEGWLKVTPSASECAAAATFSLSCKHDHSSERQSACACSPAITPPTASTRQRAFATHTASHYGQHARDTGARGNCWNSNCR